MVTISTFMILVRNPTIMLVRLFNILRLLDILWSYYLEVI